MSIQKRQLVKKKEHRLNKICHFCQKKGIKDKDFGKKFCQKKGTKTKSEKNCQKKGTVSKKRHKKKGTSGVYETTVLLKIMGQKFIFQIE